MNVGRTERSSFNPILDLYLTLLREIWESVSALIGETILCLLFNVAVRKIEQKHPFLSSVRVSEDGLDLEETKRGCAHLPPAEVHRGFQSLINQLSLLFAELTEWVITKELLPKVLPKVREAERMVLKK